MEYKRADDQLFGKYCYIDTPWIAGEKTIYRIIRSGVRSNSWCEVPVNGLTKKVNHGEHSEEIVFVMLDTLIDEDTKIMRFALKDVEIIEMADRKTEQENCEGCRDGDCWGCPLVKQTGPQKHDWHDDCNTCRWHDGACTIPCCDYEPKTEPQTLDDIGRQIQDAYDKGLISDADAVQAWYEAVKTDPQSDARKFLGYACETCKHRDEEWDSEACDGCCENDDHYEPQTDIGTSDTVYSDTAGYVPRVDMTDCSWKKGE